MKKPTGKGRIVADKRNFDQAPQSRNSGPPPPLAGRASARGAAMW
ncbi:hypothetical protein [Paracoccus thiocyanatus]|nr:hypothetical protein [Paracoccus thiocyanatus]